MGFLDNSGDIILDAVLTDTGRFRLAKGDGSFKIMKYAFADDEIDYSKYEKNHASGSAYYDLDVLKTPVLEAFTNNTSMMKHKLMSIPRSNLLYLPIILLSEENTSTESGAPGFKRNSDANQADGMYVVAVDLDTETELLRKDGEVSNTVGLIAGATYQLSPKSIRLDQGLDTAEISPFFPIDPDLRETRFIMEIDNRLGYITDRTGSPKDPHFIDDDQIASYSFSSATDPEMISDLAKEAGTDLENNYTKIKGPRGNYFHFGIRSSLELETSEYLFTKLGSSTLTTGDNAWSTKIVGFTKVLYIDTNVRVTGATTGYSVDVPVRFAKVSKS